MDVRSGHQLPTLIKAMTDVVLPAIDARNKLAQEQGHLVVAMLRLMEQRAPLQFRYDRADLASFLGLADQISSVAVQGAGLGPSVESLASAAAQGRDVLERARAEPSELEAANLRLRAAVGQVLQASAGQPPHVRDAIEAAAFAHSADLLLRERAWLAPQGWEGASPDLPDVLSLID